MKYGISTRPHGVRSPRPPSPVPGHRPAAFRSSPYPFAPSPKTLGLTGSTRFLARRQPFHFSLHTTAGPLNPIQNPKSDASAANTGGFVQVAVSNARRAKFPLLRSLVQPARIRYSPMTFQAESSVASLLSHLHRLPLNRARMQWSTDRPRDVILPLPIEESSGVDLIIVVFINATNAETGGFRSCHPLRCVTTCRVSI